ncbi:MAG: winged helix-turn-helix transcriptional regulator [Proteobacteria bacterium]|nr:winged helix-turn-helix transcriptional regulator [Pseudomonadota bacterium]
MLNICLRTHNTVLREALKELLPQAGISLEDNLNDCMGFLYTPPFEKETLPSLNFMSLPHPLKLIELVSFLENLPYTQVILFAHFSLDLREKVLKNFKNQEEQRLTEKECQLLRFFHQYRGQELSKEKLLQEIWGYHPDAETHTLETHIYRLRQKLEDDPNIPQILLNGKEGYWIQ